jgi:fido (protein-threonine AMPylation protein)
MTYNDDPGNEPVSSDHNRLMRIACSSQYARRIAASLDSLPRELAAATESIRGAQTSWTAGDHSTAPDGTSFVLYNGLIYAGGDRNWRNNNPGNIEAGNFAKTHGAIGDDGHYAVFPDAQTGMNALIAVLQTPKDNDLLVRDVMSTYAPPGMNNTQGYLQFVKTQTGLDPATPMKSLTFDQLESVANAIRKYEGNKAGQIYLKDSSTNPRWAQDVFQAASASAPNNPLELVTEALKGPIPKERTLPNIPKTQNLDELVQQLEIQRRVVDARLTKPARWRGQMRREVHKHDRPGEKERYTRAFDQLVAEVYANPHWELDAGKLKTIHDAAVGGGEFRNVQIRVGRHHAFPEVTEVPALVDQVLRRANNSREPAPVTAIRLYLELLTIHPFLDGNGRTTRLIATLWLVRAGFRSTLFTAVEQHFHPTPARYVNILDQLRYGDINTEQCIAYLLRAMVANSIYATWFREREQRLRKACNDLGIPVEYQDEVMEEYDLRHHPEGWADALANLLDPEELPLHTTEAELTPMQRTEFAFQLQRILDEEQEDA